MDNCEFLEKPLKSLKRNIVIYFIFTFTYRIMDHSVCLVIFVGEFASFPVILLFGIISCSGLGL